MAQIQPDALIRANAEIYGRKLPANSDENYLTENGGKYASAEIRWYRGQMDEIDALVEDSKVARSTIAAEKSAQMEELLKDPTKEFNSSYTSSIH